MFENPSPDALRALLGAVKTIAVVGASPKPERPAHRIAKFLQAQGYRVIPVHPAIDSLFGEKAYPSLSAIPEAVDLADFFVSADRVGALVDEAIALKIPRLWLQDGVIDEAAALRAQAAGVQVVMDDCIYRRFSELMR